MNLSLPVSELQDYLVRQMAHFFPDGQDTKAEVRRAFSQALERQEYCFSHISVPGYTKDGAPYFSHMHSDQYSSFLYYLANSLWKMGGDERVCSKLVVLNRALHGCWMSYKGGLPDIFVLVHPVGTVLGNASYGDYLVVLQNVTVNTARDEDGGAAPHLGRRLILFAGAKIIGNQTVGDNVTIGVDAVVHKRQIPSNTLVYRDEMGQIRMKSHTERPYFYDYFKKE